MADPSPLGQPHTDPWLAPFLSALRHGGSQVVELGCGPGLDAAWLIAQGFGVVGCDRSLTALGRARVNAPAGLFFRADIGRPLPFADCVAGSVVSSSVRAWRGRLERPST